jgi:hypothetical protein
MIAGDKLLGLVDLKSFEAIDGEIGEHFEGVGAFHIQIGHVVRLVKEGARFFPGALLVSPIGKLGTHDRERVGSNLRIPQEFDRAAGGL